MSNFVCFARETGVGDIRPAMDGTWQRAKERERERSSHFGSSHPPLLRGALGNGPLDSERVVSPGPGGGRLPEWGWLEATRRNIWL